MGFLVYPFLSREVLDGFKYKYKYSSKDTSPFANYVMHPFWDKLVLLLPMWVAPNLLTFSGFLVLALHIGILACFDPQFNAVDTQSIPNWVWLYSSISIFVAHQLDGTDGKQARRNGSSSPLGELFDHGIDSLSTFFLPVGAMSLFGQGPFGQPPINFLFVLYSIQLPFILSQWEKYLTGILYLPWSYDIGMAGVTITYFSAWYIGGDQFRQYYVYGDVTLSTALVSFCLISVVFSTVVTLYNIFKAYLTNTGRRMENLYEAVLPLFSSTLLFTVVTTWAFYSPSDVIVNHKRWLLTLQGFIFSNIASRLIISHMSLTRSQPVNAFVALLVAGLAILTGGAWLLGPQNVLVLMYEVYFLKGITIFVVAAHLYFGYCVVNQMAGHLKIRVFKVKPKVPAKKN